VTHWKIFVPAFNPASIGWVCDIELFLDENLEKKAENFRTKLSILEGVWSKCLTLSMSYTVTFIRRIGSRQQIPGSIRL
jgi:hypothetical protein